MSIFLNLLQKTNGKVAKLEIMPIAEQDQLLYSIHTMRGSLALATAKQWIQINFSNGSALLEDVTRRMPAGHIHSFNISCQLPGITREVYVQLMNSPCLMYHAKVTLIDGTVLLLTDLGILSKLEHGRKVSDFSGFVFRMASRTVVPMLFWYDLPVLGATGPGNGFIFYLDQENLLAFEAMPTHTSQVAPFKTLPVPPTPIGTFREIGAGKQNTEKALEAIAGDTIFSLTLLPSGTPKEDWVVPSLMELLALFNCPDIPAAILYPDIHYWSSSEQTNTAAYVIDTNLGVQDNMDVTSEIKSILIRSFPLLM